MSDKWYNEHNCDWFDEEREHRRILRKRIESACRIATVVSLLCIIGLVGGAEQGRISLGQFAVYELGAVAVLITSIRLGITME